MYGKSASYERIASLIWHAAGGAGPEIDSRDVPARLTPAAPVASFLDLWLTNVGKWRMGERLIFRRITPVKLNGKFTDVGDK